jgi:hypothetical protein
MRNRTGPVRAKADENAVGRHVRQSSAVTAGAPRAAHIPVNVHALKNGGAQRAALGEVTTVAVNRKVSSSVLASYCLVLASRERG